MNNIVKRFTNKMGMYLSQNSVTEESLMDCKTKEEYTAYYIKFNDLHPNEYFKVAKTKLKDLTGEQKRNIDSVLGDDDMTIKEKWEKYCNILDIAQINYVGW